MVKERKGTGPVKIEAVAKANIGATYSVTKKVTEVVPEDVTRAKATSWLDLISPLTEWAGLRGDQLRLKRDILRLQREETLSRIASVIQEKGPIRLGDDSIPTKFIVNYLEKASLEKPDDELVQIWANLLISAAENYNPRQLHFVNIVSQMSSAQAKIFESLIGTNNLRDLDLAYDLIEEGFGASKIKEYVTHFVKNELTVVDFAEANLAKSIEKLGDTFGTWLNCVGVEFVYGDVGAYNDRMEMREIYCDASVYEDDKEIDYRILTSLGIAEYVDTGFMLVDKFEFTLKYYHITALGVSFAKACKIVA
jgi:hypothetical protein